MNRLFQLGENNAIESLFPTAGPLAFNDMEDDSSCIAYYLGRFHDNRCDGPLHFYCKAVCPHGGNMGNVFFKISRI